jgi:hypothetical protein
MKPCKIISDHSRFKGRMAMGEKLEDGGIAVVITGENDGKPMWFNNDEIEFLP